MAILQSDGVSVKVVSGDTLSEIALEFKDKISGSDNEARIQTLVTLNNIKNRDLIYVGQILKLSGTATSDDANNSSKAIITAFGRQAGETSSTVLFAIWTWDKSNTENYEVKWYYDAGNKDTDGNTIWFLGTDGTVEEKQSTYNVPSNAKRVRFKVKPISKKKSSSSGSETTYWTASWSSYSTYNCSDNPPLEPDSPTVTIEDGVLKAELANIAEDINATHIQFQIVKDDKKVFKTGRAKIKTRAASYSCNVDAGSKYKVRCRSYRDDIYSEWSDYCANVESTPETPSEITTIRAEADDGVQQVTSVYLEWSAVSTADTYDIEYTTDKKYFDISGNPTSVTGIKTTSYIVSGLTTGDEYFFRVRAVNEAGESKWSGIKSVVIGSTPAAPTTWSSTTTATVGEDVILYWVHNSEDGSSQKNANVELILDEGTESEVSVSVTIKNLTDAENKDKTRTCTIETSTGHIKWVEDDGDHSKYLGRAIPDGTKLKWRVRTSGITNVYGDWSIDRLIDIYLTPTLELSVTDSAGDAVDDDIDSVPLTGFPVLIKATPGPDNQAPIGYHVSVFSNEIYETTDRLGNTKIVNTGEAVFSKYFDVYNRVLETELTAGNIDLENNISYTVEVTVSMNSGLTSTATSRFVVYWADYVHEPNAEITIDTTTYTANIRPYCEDENGDPIEGILLSVYRREFDGSFIEIASGLVNTENTCVTDPHPSLDFARYRIVAITEDTGAVTYCDLAGIPVGGKAVVIQWNEDWSSFESTEDAELEQPPWAGSMLKLPGNIDVSEDAGLDVALVKYIGREHPVSYYGTHIGQSAAWSMEIEKADKETLYNLRRLQRWMGDVYVREPSGSGYWANITVSFSQKHLALTIPVSMKVTRVEGGV